MSKDKTLSRIARINQRRRENYKKMRDTAGMPYTARPDRRILQEVPDDQQAANNSIDILEAALRGD